MKTFNKQELFEISQAINGLNLIYEITKEPTISFIFAMKDFFGLKIGQKPKDFSTEINILDNRDRVYFKTGLEQNGYNIQ